MRARGTRLERRRRRSPVRGLRLWAGCWALSAVTGCTEPDTIPIECMPAVYDARLTPAADTLLVGEQLELHLSFRYARCYHPRSPAGVSWFVGGPAIESVMWGDSSAVVRAVAPGNGHVTAYFEGTSPRADILVFAP